jgi:outer membrane autotransporter protein
VNANSSLSFYRADTVTFSGAISGAGNIGVAGGGTVQLTGTSTYTGETDIGDAGTVLAIGDATNIGSGEVIIRFGAALRFDGALTLANDIVLNGGTFDTNGNNVTLSGAFTGGGLTKIGAGTLTLTDTTFLGGNMSVEAGTLEFATPGDIVIQGAVTGAGTIEIGAGTNAHFASSTVTPNFVTDASDATVVFSNIGGGLTYQGVISGSGRFQYDGTDSMVLTGTNTYTGGTIISSGTVTLGDGSTTGSIVGDVIDNGTIAFNRSDDVTFDGAISGSGGLTKNGDGMLTLTAANGYAGPTLVNSGTLSVNGSIASSTVTVSSGATLGGTGTVGSTTVSANGRLAAGNSIGTLSINGDLTLQNGSLVLAEISPTTADLINASGAVSIAGNLKVTTAAGVYAPHVYTLITSTGALSGMFGSVSGTAPTGFAYTVSTDAHNAFLNLIYKQFIWSSNPSSSDWFADANWQNGLAPPANVDVFFGATTRPAVDISLPPGAVEVASLQFTSATPGYTFNVLSNTGFNLTGQGINDPLNSAPQFVVQGAMGFINAATAGDARIEVTATGVLGFIDNSTPGSAALTADAGSLVIFQSNGPAGDGSVTAGSIAGAGHFAINTGNLHAGSNNTSTEVSRGISGVGGLTKTGTGTLTLSATNTYTGGTTITGGTLQLGNGGTTGSVVGDIVDNATLAFNRSDDLDFAARISGTGGVVKNGADTLRLMSNNTYTGATAVNGGTLVVVGNNNSSAIAVNSGGTLAVIGSAAGDITVNSGGTLTMASGSQAVNVAVGNGGTFSLADGAADTFSLDGKLTLGGTYKIDVVNTSSDRVFADDVVTLGGTLLVDMSNSVSQPLRYTILSGTAIAGSFASINSTGLPTGFVIGVSTTSTTVFLDLDYAAFIWGANPATTDWSTDANWQAGLSPASVPGGQNILFGATSKPTVDIGTDVNESSLQFTAGTPSYTFNIAAGSTLSLGGLGIVDGAGNKPTFNVAGNFELDGNAHADDARLVAQSGGTITFADQSTASTALITVKSGGQLVFFTNSTPGAADIVADGTVNFFTSGTLGDNNISANSIAGSGRFYLGSNRLTVGAGNASTEVSGVIDSIGGGLTKVGTGTLILSGANTYVGGTTIAAGTLQIGNGGTTGAVTGNIVDNGALIFNRSNALTFVGIVSGTGSLTKAGAGTLTLASANTYTGATQVTAGTLSLTGSVTSVVTVSGGTLAGTGTMAGLAVASGGTVSPGVGGVGTLQVNGATSLASGATYAFDATTGVSDLILTTGAASLGGTVAVTVTPGTYTINSRIALVTTTAGVSGAFSGLTVNGSFGSNVRAVFDYDANHAYLLMRPVAISTLLPPDASENVVDIAAAIDEAILNGNGGNTFGPLADLNQADLVKVLEQMDGEVSNGVPDGAFENLGSFLELLLDPANENRSGGGGPALSFIAPDDHLALSFADPVAAASPRPAEGGSAVFLRGPVSVWGSLKGGWSNHGGDAVLGSHPTNVSNGLMALGVDIRPEGQDLVLGAGAALGQVWWNVHPGLGSGHSNSQQFGVYGSKRFGSLYVSLAGAFAQFQSNTARTVIFGGPNAYQAHVRAQAQGLRGEVGYRFEEDGTGLTPYASFQAQAVTTSAYDEKTVVGNPAFALHFPHQRETEVSSELGLAIDRLLSSANDNELSFEGRLGWWHDYSSDISRTGSLLAFPGTSFVVRGVSPARDAAQVSVGLDADIGDGLSLKAKAQSLLSGNVQEYGGNLTLSLRW